MQYAARLTRCENPHVTSASPAPMPRTPAVPRRPRPLDALVLGVIGIIAVVGALTIGTAGVPGQLETWRPGGYLALAVSTAGIAVAWRWPWPGLSLVAAAPVASTLLGWDPIVTWNLAVFAALWLTLRALPGLWVGLVVGAANFAAVAMAQGGFSLQEPIPSVAGISALAAAATGSAIRSHRRYRAELEARTREALATREAEAQRRVAEERVRIARDLHDIVGHQVALVSMRLGAAQVHLPADAHEARADLDAVRGGIQEILAGTQQTLRMLRAASEEEDATTPAAGFERIDDLVRASRAAGLDVEATVARPPRPLGAPVSAAAFRIVQEALTNAQKHGTGAVSLKVGVDDEAITVEAVNVRADRDGGDAPTRAERNGYGLVGMRERAASVGGWIDTKTDDGLFWLWAYLPVEGGDQQ